MPPLRLITRISIFSAMFYVISWAFVSVPDINPGFFVVFSAGFLWGAVPGMIVGSVGMGLFTTLNPLGPAGVPVSVAQVGGMSLVGLLGFCFACSNWKQWTVVRRNIMMVLAGILSTGLFFLPVSLIDAWVYRPFWPRIIASAVVTILPMIFNALTFPLLFVVIQRVHERESRSVSRV